MFQPGFIPTILADSIEVYIGTGATGVAVAASHTLSSVVFVQLPGQTAACTFTPADVGMPIAIIGGGVIDPLMPMYFVRGAMFHTTIASYVSPTEVTLTDAPTTSIANSGFVTVVCYRRAVFQMDTFTMAKSIAPGTRNTAGFVLLSDSEYIQRFELIARGQPVYITSSDSNANIEFGGSINTLDVANQPGCDTGVFSWTCGCVNWASIAMRRIVNSVNATVYTGAGDAVFKKIVFTNMIDEGVSVNAEVAPTVSVGAPTGAYINTLLDQLVQDISTPTQQWYWDVGPWREYILKKRETVAAPWAITDGYDLLAGNQPIQVLNSTSGDQLANFVYGIGTNVLFNSLNVTVVGDGTARTFNLPQAIATVPTITLNGGSQTVGILGVETGKDWYWNQGSATLTQDGAGTVLTASDTLLVLYQFTNPGVAKSPNVASLQERSNVECTSGSYDYSFQITQPILPNDLLAQCTGYQQVYGVQPQAVKLSTLRPGLDVGQLQPISYPNSGISGNFLIATIKISTNQQVIQWDYTAFKGANVGNGITGLVQFINRGTNALALTSPSQAISAAYNQITIDHTKVAGGASLTNFTFCFRGTYAFLADLANGGKVANSNGSDIFFSSDSGGGTVLDFDLDTYNSATGEIVAWVRIASLSHTVDTVLYVQYGDASIVVSLANPPGVWSPNVEVSGSPNNNFRAVYHFGEASAPYDDSTAYARNTTSGSSATRVAGFFGFAQAFTGAQSIVVPQPLSGNAFGNAKATISCWIKRVGAPSADEGALQDIGGVSQLGLAIGLSGTTGQAFGVNSDGGFIRGGANICDGDWHYIAYTTDPTGAALARLYVDGVQVATSAALTTPIGGTYDADVAGLNTFAPFIAMTGDLDELHWTQAPLSAGWIATEWANQFAPTTFYTFGALPAATTDVVANPQGTVTHTTGALTLDLPVLGNGGADIKSGVAGQLVPPGGTTNQVLTKLSGADYDDGWVDPSAGGGSVLSGTAPPGVSVAMIQHTKAVSSTVAFPVDVTAGNLLIVMARNNTTLPNPTVVADTQLNTWTQGAYGAGSNGSFPNQVSICYAIASASGPCTITATGALSVIIAEFTPGMTMVDDSGGTTAGVGGPPAPTLTLGTAADLVINAITFDSTGYTASGESIIDTTANQGASWTLSGAAGSFVSSITAGANTNQGFASLAFVTGISPSGGVDGDWYLNTDTHEVFGPKASGAWPSPEYSWPVPLTAVGDLLGTDGATPIAVPVGTDGNVLTADSGAAAGWSWQPGGSGGGGGLVLLESHAASSSGELDFTSWYSTSYDDYLIEFVNMIPGSNSVDLQIQLSTDGGATYQSSGYVAGLSYTGTTAATGSSSVGGGAAMQLTVAGISNAATGGLCGALKLFSPGSAALHKIFRGETGYYAPDANFYANVNIGAWKATTAVNALRVLMSSGNIASGTVRIYGLAK